MKFDIAPTNGRIEVTNDGMAEWEQVVLTAMRDLVMVSSAQLSPEVLTTATEASENLARLGLTVVIPLITRIRDLQSEIVILKTRD